MFEFNGERFRKNFLTLWLSQFIRFESLLQEITMQLNRCQLILSKLLDSNTLLVVGVWLFAMLVWKWLANVLVMSGVNP